METCTLNQNPPKTIIDNEEDKNPTSSHIALSHSEWNRNMEISQEKKRLRSFKKKHLQEFLYQNSFSPITHYVSRNSWGFFFLKLLRPFFSFGIAIFLFHSLCERDMQYERGFLSSSLSIMVSTGF